LFVFAEFVAVPDRKGHFPAGAGGGGADIVISSLIYIILLEERGNERMRIYIYHIEFESVGKRVLVCCCFSRASIKYYANDNV